MKRNRRRSYSGKFFTIFLTALIFLLFFTSLFFDAAAKSIFGQPPPLGPIPAPTIADYILKSFLLNIFPTVMLIMLPLFLLVRFRKEERISPLWSFGAALLGIWVAYIDMSSLHYIQEYEYNNPPLALFVEFTAIFAFFISFFIIVYPVMKQKLISGIIIASGSVVFNLLAWKHLKIIYGYSALAFCGISVITIALILHFMADSWIRIRMDCAEAVRLGEAISPKNEDAMLNRSFALYMFIQFIFLLLWPFFILILS